MVHVKISLKLQNSKFPADNLSKDEQKALKELKPDTSIIILTAGKSRSTVILNCVDYLKKCMDHLNNINNIKEILLTKSKRKR